MDQAAREAQWAGWMRAAIGGDEAAYRQLLDALSVHLRASVRWQFARAGHGDLEVEDVVQETLLAVHLKRHTWRAAEPVSPWIAAICRNKLIDALRRRGRRAETALDDVPEAELQMTAGDSGAGHDLARALESLDGRQREIVRLVAVEGHAARIAAGQLGMSEGAVRVALHRSLRALAAKMRREHP